MGIAQVSSKGRFRTTRGVTYTPRPRRNGYVEVAVGGRRHKLHRLIAVAFGLPKRADQTQINHKNNDPSDNRPCNLEWVTRSENIRHSYATNADRASSATRTSKAVRTRAKGSSGEWTMHASVHDAARALGVSRGNVYNCLAGKRQHTGGFEFARMPPAEDLPGEEWRSVGGARVSSLGRFESTLGVRHTPKPTTNGYVVAWVAGKIYYVHRLVAEAFELPRPSADHVEVNHKNNDPSDNRLCNLEWVTRSENVQHSYDTNAERRTKTGMVKPVRARAAGSDDEWAVYAGGALEAAAALGIARTNNIHRACLGLRKQAGGYEFEYAGTSEGGDDDEVWKNVVVVEY